MVLSHRHYQPFSRHTLPCFATRTIVPMYFATKSLKKIEKSSFREAILFLQFSTYPFSVFEKNILKSFFSVFECMCSHRILTQIIVQYKLWIYLKVVFLIWSAWSARDFYYETSECKIISQFQLNSEDVLSIEWFSPNPTLP